MGDEMELSEKIKNFILTEICPEQNIQQLSEDEPLIESGIIDSLGVLKILAFLDEQYGIDLASSEIKPENFKTIRSICELVSNQKETG